MRVGLRMDESKRSTATSPRQTRKSSSVMDAARENARSSTKTNGGLGGIEDVDAESELSEPDSDAGSPPDIAKEMSANRASPSDANDQEMRDAAEDEETPISHYPKRKRNSMYQNLNDNKSDLDVQLEDDKSAHSKAPPTKRPASAGRLSVTSTAAMRAVNLGHWRDSPVTEVARKHSVIGFIDARDRLRTRIQTTNSRDEQIAKEHPLPPGPGGSWLTFDKIAFLPHLVGLDQYEVKEYVRMRRDARPDETEAEREKADMEAVEKAQRHLSENPNIRNPTVQPIIAYGQDLPAEQTTGRPESKRRRTSGNFTPIVPANGNGTGPDAATPDQPSTPSPVALDPLPGTRPTRILIGYWKGSNQVKEADRHAVYGILGQNDMFRVKLTRETRDGRRMDGNFPAGAGALWIGYDEVAHEPHLKDFNRQEIKEFCRVRQWQIDQAGDEKDEERQENIKEASLEAKKRVHLLAGNTSVIRSTPAARSAPAATPFASNTDNDASTVNTTSGPETPIINGHSNGTNPEQRQSRRLAEPRNMDRAERADGHTRRQFVDIEPRPASSRVAPSDAVERANALARREIERVEAAQGRADRNAPYRERAARAAAMDAANAAALSAISSSSANRVNGTAGSRLNESEHMQRLNAVWAKQESLRARSGTEDAKVYDGVKYERKATGPFVGKLVSQGHIINIDGEDYVEYRVLTKPSFF